MSFWVTPSVILKTYFAGLTFELTLATNWLLNANKSEDWSLFHFNCMDKILVNVILPHWFCLDLWNISVEWIHEEIYEIGPLLLAVRQMPKNEYIQISCPVPQGKLKESLDEETQIPMIWLDVKPCKCQTSNKGECHDKANQTKGYGLDLDPEIWFGSNGSWSHVYCLMKNAQLGSIFATLGVWTIHS